MQSGLRSAKAQIILVLMSISGDFKVIYLGALG